MGGTLGNPFRILAGKIGVHLREDEGNSLSPLKNPISYVAKAFFFYGLIKMVVLHGSEERITIVIAWLFHPS